MKIIVLEYGEPVGADAVRLVSKTVRWHPRPGKIKRGGNSGSNNSQKKPRHYTSQLVENSMALGYLNGVRIRRKR